MFGYMFILIYVLNSLKLECVAFENMVAFGNMGALRNTNVFEHPSCLREIKVSSDNSIAFRKVYARMTLPHESWGHPNYVVLRFAFSS